MSQVEPEKNDSIPFHKMNCKSRVCVCVCVCACVFVHILANVCVCAYMHVCMIVCMCAYICVCVTGLMIHMDQRVLTSKTSGWLSLVGLNLF